MEQIQAYSDMSVAERISDIRRRIAAAAGAAGRPEAEITLVAATKTQTSDTVREAVAGGVDACGENRVQELTAKYADGAYTGRPLHFIGHLQRNKVKQVVGRADLIESVDSVELLRLIDIRARESGIIQDVLIEVNIAGEEAKSGVAPSELPELLTFAGLCGALRVRGLMSVPPVSAEKGGNRRYFAEMRQLFVDIGTKKYDNVSMDFLSMGMSGDFEDAVAEGANIVRVGTAIFGPRG